MSKYLRWFGAAVLAGAFLAAVVPSGAVAEDKKTDDKKAGEVKKTPEEMAAETIANTMKAYELAEFGRKNNAPDALIAAARLFNKVAKAPIKPLKTKPEVTREKDADKDAPLVDEVAKDADFEKEADALLDEAKSMGVKLNVNVVPLVKLAEEQLQKERDTGTRAVIGGPKMVTRVVGPHQTQQFRFQFQNHQHMAIAFKATTVMKFQVVHDQAGTIWADGLTAQRLVHGAPGGPKGQNAVFTIRITNPNRVNGKFMMQVN